MTLEFFASASKNTESALCDELRELGFQSVRLNRGGIPFRGDWSEGWRACLESRIAQRIMVLMGRGMATNADELYREVQAVDWGLYLTAEKTLSVQCVTVGSQLNHSGFVALRAKDAIVDQIRERWGDRPSIDRDDADVRVFVYLANDKLKIYLDLSGQPLHLRGYRAESGEAPLRENLAASMLRMSGWDRQSPLIDPMCGSGTIAIEAAQWAQGLAPGLARTTFGFQRWASFDEDSENQLRLMKGELRGAARGQRPSVIARDVDGEVLDIARGNARKAGVRLSFKEQSVFDLQADGPVMTLVSNPPYGKRLAATPDFLDRMGAVFRKLHGWRIALLAGSRAIEEAMKVKPANRIPIPNGDLPCDLLIYEID